MTTPLSPPNTNPPISGLNQPPTVHPYTPQTSHEGSIHSHPDAPRSPSFFSRLGGWITAIYLWILSWFKKPEKEDAKPSSPPNQTPSPPPLTPTQPQDKKPLSKEAALKYVEEFQGPRRQGQITLECITPVLIFDLEKHDFNGTLHLVNNDSFYTFPDDFVCRYTLKEEEKPEIEIRLPSSVFRNTRIENRLFFIQSGTLYILTLVGTAGAKAPPWKFRQKGAKKGRLHHLIPFDESYQQAATKAKEQWEADTYKRYKKMEQAKESQPSTPLEPSHQQNGIELFIKNFQGPVEKHPIKIVLRGARYIGTDAKYQFGKTISLLNGSPLRVDPQNFYCDIQRLDDLIGRFIELPSSLFKQARTQDTIHYIRDGTLWILLLDPNFDSTLKAAEEEAQENFGIFRYVEDIPDDYVQWISDQSQQDGIFLSSQCRRIMLNTKGTSPVDFSNLKRPPNMARQMVPPRRIYNKDTSSWEIRFKLTYHTAELEIVLDECRLFIYADYSSFQPSLTPGYQTNNDTFIKKAFGYDIIPYNEGNFKLDEVSATLSERILTITIPIIPKTHSSQ